MIRGAPVPETLSFPQRVVGVIPADPLAAALNRSSRSSWAWR